MNNLEIKVCLEEGNLEKISNEEIADWIFSEAERDYAENKTRIEEKGFRLPYTGNSRGRTDVDFSGAVLLWSQRYSQENIERLSEISKLAIDRINKNYEKLINEKYVMDISWMIFFLSMQRLVKIDSSKNMGLKNSLESLYKKLSKSKEDFQTEDKQDIFNNFVASLAYVDIKNKEKYLSRTIK